MKTFFLWLGRMGSFHTDFKNVHMTQKSFAQKPIFLGPFSIGKIVFGLKLFLGALFTKVISPFLKSLRKDKKKKSFIS